MTQLSNSPIGFKRSLSVNGISGWDVASNVMTVMFRIEIRNSSNIRIEDKAIEQDRVVSYQLNNDNRVNNQFNPVASGGTGEYDFFNNLLKTSVSFYSIIESLSDKLNERGIFD